MKTSTIDIACPSCATRYKVPKGREGAFVCKSCGAKVTIAAAAAALRGKSGKAQSEQRLAKQMMIGGGVAAVIILGIVALAGGKSGGPAPVANNAEADRRAPIAPLSDDAAVLRRQEETREKKKIAGELGRDFLTALGKNDREQVRALFLFQRHFERTAAAAKPGDTVQNYAAATSAEKTAMEEKILDALLDPTRAVYIDKQLLPRLQDNINAGSLEMSIDSRPWTLKYTVNGEDNDALFFVNLDLDIKPGIDPEMNWASTENWGISKMAVQWVRPLAETGQKKQAGAVDVVKAAEDQERRDARRAAREAGGGPPEAEPTPQSPVDGTGETQIAAIRQLITTLTSGGGREVNVARRDLVTMGKVAIPFLLNELALFYQKEDKNDILKAWVVVQTLREITGFQCGFAPGTSAPGTTLAATSADERARAVRRWFAWWKSNAKSFTGPPQTPEDEAPTPPPGGGGRRRS